MTPADSGLNLAIAVHAAKKAVADFLQAHISRDAALLERSTDVPFRDYPEKLYTTREELHAAYKNTVPAPGLTWRILAFVTIEEQLTIAGTDEEREYLRGLPGRGLVAVHVAINEEGQNGTQALALVVRVQGARGRVIGIVDSVIRP